MESTGELEAVTMCGEIDIKEEPVLTDPNWQLFEETEHIFIKEENVKLETPEDPDAHDPLQLKKEESPPQEETISPPDAIHTKKEPELQKEVEATSCGIEPRSMIPTGAEDNSADGSGGLATRVGLAAGIANIVQCTTKAAVFSTHKTGTRHLAYSCATCKKKFAHLQDLEEHEHTDSREFQHSCTVCHKTLKSSSTLKVHLRLHTGERPHRCDVCHKAFTTSGALKAHSRQHTGECPYTCKVCHKTFRSQGTLWSHSRLHTGERPHVCKVCHKKFISNSCLKKHSRVHSGLRQFTCDLCLNIFTGKRFLNMHSQPFSCRFCHKKFLFPSSLNNHVRVHTGDLPFNCCVCHKTFTLSSISVQPLQLHSG